MNIYSLTQAEVDALNAINYTRQNTLLIVSDFGTHKGVDPIALQASEYSAYLTALGPYDANKVVAIDIDAIEAANVLAAKKTAKVIAIDNKSRIMLTSGLTVATGKTISTSMEGQQNLQDMYIGNLMGIITFPLGLSTLDGKEYIITDVIDAIRIANLLKDAKLSVLNAGRALRIQVLAATTEAKVDAVIDNR